jgi:hypothetical protein
MNKLMRNINGTRTFKRYWKDNKLRVELISWIDKRCEVCGKFVSRFNTKSRCERCSKKHHVEYTREYMRNRRYKV